MCSSFLLSQYWLEKPFNLEEGLEWLLKEFKEKECWYLVSDIQNRISQQDSNLNARLRVRERSFLNNFRPLLVRIMELLS